MNTNTEVSTSMKIKGVINAAVLKLAQEQGFDITITHSEGAMSPRASDRNDITSVFVTGVNGRSASLGDERMVTDSSYTCIADAIDAYADAKGIQREDLMCFTVYKCEVGDIALSTQPIDGYFNSSIAGFIFESRAKLREEFGVQRVSPRLTKQVEARLQEELCALSAWANGAVYDVSLLDEDGDTIDVISNVYNIGSSINDAADELVSNGICAV